MISLFSSNSNSAYKKLAYDFSFKDLDGSEFRLSEYKNKVLVVTNVASYCGFTSQYEDLQEIWEKYQTKGLIVIGVFQMGKRQSWKVFSSKMEFS